MPAIKQKSIDSLPRLSTDFTPSLTVHITPSMRLLLYILVSHLMALICLFFIEMSLYVLIGLSVAIVISVYLSYRHYWPIAKQVLRYGIYGWALEDSQGVRRMHLKGRVLIWPGLIILPFLDSSGKKVTLLLLSDSACSQDLRRLRVLLRTGLRG